MRKSLLTLSLLSLLGIAACGKEKDPFEFDPGAGGGNAGGGAAALNLNATVKGKIVFEGTAPMPKKIWYVQARMPHVRISPTTHIQAK